MSARFGTRNPTDRTDRTDQTDPISQTARPRALCAPPRAGYTLIELISVAALGTILISLAVAGYHTWTRDNSVVSAQRRVQSLLVRARSHALAHGVETRWRVVLPTHPNPRAHAIVLESRKTPTPTEAWRLIAPTNILPDWSEVVDGQDYATNVVFDVDGSCRPDDAPTSVDPPAGWLQIKIRHTNIRDLNDSRYHRTLEINRRTGLVRDGLPEGNP